jgi:phosphate starvation-inducible PhoH-like protein
MYEEEITKNAKGKPIRVKTIGQREYIAAMKRHDLIFGIGPAGTGKTYLAVVKAVHELKNGRIKKIILTRPAVEAGESLGFLPGDLKEKVDPYLRPLYDALHDVLGTDHTARLLERGTIEIAPLAYMRGRTLDDAFVILDEAQNTTPAQMKMFLTRLGFGSKMVITGDITQIDLPKGVTSGLAVAKKMLLDIEGISIVELDQTDVVRHPLVARIIEAYEKSK